MGEAGQGVELLLSLVHGRKYLLKITTLYGEYFLESRNVPDAKAL